MASNETNDLPEPSDTSVDGDRANTSPVDGDRANTSPVDGDRANTTREDDDATTQDARANLPKVSRRKLAYVAPALVSRAMFYGAAGCGKGDPRIFACQALRRGSS